MRSTETTTENIDGPVTRNYAWSELKTLGRTDALA